MRSSFLFLLLISFISCQTERSAEPEHSDPKVSADPKILFVVSNAHYYGDSDIEATNHFPEIIYAYEEFVKAGFHIDFVSPDGGEVAIGYIGSSDSIMKKYLYDAAFMDKLEHTLSPAQIDVDNYLATYFTGGGSAMFTVPDSDEIHAIAAYIYEQNGGIVSAICHGTAGIADLRLKNGDYLVEGKNITGFPDLFENKSGSYYAQFPFSIEEQVRKNGGRFDYSSEGWDGHQVTDGRVVTGQDPTSAHTVALEVISIIETLKPDVKQASKN